MNLEELGEFGLIKRLAKNIRIDKSVIAGIGDDAAVIKYTKDKHLLLTSDMLIEDIDFRIDYSEPQLIGWKAVCCSISDIAAMGGVPRWLVLSVGIPKHLDIKVVDEIYSGIKKAARKFNINIVGGDTSHSDKLIIDVTIAGVIEKKNLKKRSNAKLGDVIFVTGKLGGAVKLGKHLNFTPRLKESQVLVNNFDVHAMIDISDGLSNDLFHIIQMSNVGAVIYEKLLPKTKGVSLDDVLSEGEDFELLFTVPQKEAERLKKKFPHFLKTTPITEIGRIVKKSKGFKLIKADGKVIFVKPEGYDHFS